MTDGMEGMKEYLFHYWHEDRQWAFLIIARDPEDAVARVNRLPYATLAGEVALKLPASTGTRFLSRLYCWVKNRLPR